MAGVQRGVRQQTLAMRKRFLTIFAPIRFFATVASRMDFQLALIPEGFATGVAHVGHFARVYVAMRFQGASAVVEFTAIFTLVVRRPATVRFLVIVQRIIAGEFLA